MSLNFKDRLMDVEKITRNGGIDQPRLDERPVLEAERVVWFGRGDANACKALIDTLPSVGKKTAHGFGQIRDVHVVPMEVDRSAILPDGSPARPIPVDTWKSGRATLGQMLQPDDLPVDVTGFRPAYWDEENQDLCVLPVHSHLNHEQLEQIESGAQGELGKKARAYVRPQSGIAFFAEHAGRKLAPYAKEGNSRFPHACGAEGNAFLILIGLFWFSQHMRG